MKKLLLAAAAVAALSTAGCAGVQIAAPPAPVVSTRGTIADEKAYGQALNAYNAAAASYLKAVPVLPPSVKDKVKATLQRSKKALDAAHTALRDANAPTFAAQLALSIKLTAEVVDLLPKG